MADVVVREHGGGCGGDPGGNQQPPRGGCRGPKKGRKEAKNLDLRRLWKKNGKRPLPIVYDDVNHDQTWRPVGDNGDMFISFVGTLVRVIPYRYSSWDTVPASDKAPIMPSIETFFYMRSHYEGPYKNEIINGIQLLCSERYRGQKSRFKDKWFSSKGGVESAERLRQMPPPNMNHQEWSDYIDNYCRGDVVRRSQANTDVRAQQIHQSSHGRTTYTQYRYQHRDSVTLEPQV